MTLLTRYGLIGALIAAICLGWYASSLSKRLDTSQQLVKEQDKALAQQAGLIATLQVQDAQNRELIAAQLQQEQQLRQQAITNERKLRYAIKDDDCAKRDMPGAVIELLQPDTKSGTAAAGPVTP